MNQRRFGNGPQQAAAIRAMKGLPSNLPILGQGGLTDRFNRPIGIHDVVEITNLENYRPLFRVIGFEPNLDPRATVGSIKMHLVSEFIFGGVSGQPAGNVLRIMTAAEQGIQEEPVADTPSVDNPDPNPNPNEPPLVTP